MSVLDGKRAQSEQRAALNTVEQVGGCCGSRLVKSLCDGLTAEKEWRCPICGEVWRADNIGGVFHWTMRPVFLARGKVRAT